VSNQGSLSVRSTSRKRRTVEVAADRVVLSSGGRSPQRRRAKGRRAIRVVAAESFQSDGGVVTSSAEQSKGATSRFRLLGVSCERALVTAQSSGPGDAGSIFITARDTYEQAELGHHRGQTADGGNIAIRAGQMVHLVGSEVTASVGVAPRPSGAHRDRPEFVVLKECRIVANAFEGKGGISDRGRRVCRRPEQHGGRFVGQRRRRDGGHPRLVAELSGACAALQRLLERGRPAARAVRARVRVAGTAASSSRAGRAPIEPGGCC